MYLILYLDGVKAVTRITIVEALNIRFYQPDEVMKEQKYMKIEAISQAYIP